MLLNVFCFLFLFRLFSLFVETCNRNTKSRSQSANRKFHCKIWLGIEILQLVWFINDALIKISTWEFVVQLIRNLSITYWTFYSIIVWSIEWRMQRFFLDTVFSKRFGSTKGYNCDLGRKITDEYRNLFRTQSNI